MNDTYCDNTKFLVNKTPPLTQEEWIQCSRDTKGEWFEKIISNLLKKCGFNIKKHSKTGKETQIVHKNETIRLPDMTITGNDLYFHADMKCKTYSFPFKDKLWLGVETHLEKDYIKYAKITGSQSLMFYLELLKGWSSKEMNNLPIDVLITKWTGMLFVVNPILTPPVSEKMGPVKYFDRDVMTPIFSFTAEQLHELANDTLLLSRRHKFIIIDTLKGVLK